MDSLLNQYLFLRLGIVNLIRNDNPETIQDKEEYDSHEYVLSRLQTMWEHLSRKFFKYTLPFILNNFINIKLK